MADFQGVEKRRQRARSTYKDLKKHYVRIAGWLPVFSHYKTGSHHVRYLTLCAKLAIDIRYFRSKGLLFFDKQQKSYPYVTFIERDSQDYAFIAESLGRTRLPLKGDLEAILLNPADYPKEFKDLSSTFPYDIINLDFTGEVVRPADPPYNTTIRAIEKIVELQREASSRRWHMFLTFRVRRETANGGADDELRRIIESNLLNEQARAAYGARPTPTELQTSEYKEFLRIGIAKFLAGVATTRDFTFSLDASYYYERTSPDGEPYYILTLIAGFTALRSSSQLQDPRRAVAAYARCVPSIFMSNAIDVVARLRSAGESERVTTDLRPVLDEVEELGVIQ
jgi:hypothetical protein